MIQRIQSVLLFLAAAVMISVIFFPLWTKMDPASLEMVNLNAWKMTYEKYEPDGTYILVRKLQTFYIAIGAVTAAIIAIFSIFRYRNRLTQIKLGALNSLVMGATLVLSWYFSSEGNDWVAPEKQGTYQIGFYIIAVALLFNALANRFIRRDEKLVRSADRIR